MARIAVLGVPAYGHVLPMLPVIAELVRRGNDVTVYNEATFASQVVATGARFVPYPPVVRPSDFNRTLRDGNIIAAYDMVLGATPALADFSLAALGEERPDVIVYDCLAMWGYVAARRLKVPCVADSPIFVFEFWRHLSGLREFGAIARPFLARLPRLAWQWSRLLRFGLRNLPLDLPLVPFSGDRTVLLTSPRLHPMSPIHRRRKWDLVGPSIDERTRSESFDFSRLDGRPLVFVSMGTVHFGHDTFFDRCFEALADLPVQVLVAAGPGSDPSRFGAAPDNFIIEPVVPQLAVLQRAALFITHAGLGGVHEALWYGVPMVAIPQHFEQFRNAWAAGHRQAALVLDTEVYGRRVTAAEIKAAVGRVLGDPGFAKAARALGQAMRREGGYGAASDIIEAVARTGTAQPR